MFLYIYIYIQKRIHKNFALPALFIGNQSVAMGFPENVPAMRILCSWFDIMMYVTPSYISNIKPIWHIKFPYGVPAIAQFYPYLSGLIH